MQNILALLGSVINIKSLFVALALCVMVVLVAFVMAKNKKTQSKKPGQKMTYEVPGRTAAECRGILGKPGAEDIFTYKLENAQGGGWYLTLLAHNETQQPLDTVFMLQFEDDNPARLQVSFVREAFGAKEPVMQEALIDLFFNKKLGALPVREGEWTK